MTLITKQEEKFCFAPCSEDKVREGNCDCINRMKKTENQKSVEIYEVDSKSRCNYCGRTEVCKGSYPEGCFLENQNKGV